MKVCGIVAEYNPFHNGHKFHIDVTKNACADAVVAVMSGNFVQRGDAAFFEKHLRARAAIMNGVDLVLELPTPYAVSSADKFAFGALSVLNSLGCVDYLSFGSECGDVELIKEAAGVSVGDEIKVYLENGSSYPAAYQKAVENKYGEKISSALSNPNNILGVEYIRAINSLKSSIEPFSVLRNESDHNSAEPSNGFCSAEYIRNNYFAEDISEFMPESSFNIMQNSVEKGFAPAGIKNVESAVLYSLRNADADFIKSLPDVSEGIENRLLSAAREATSLEDIYSLAKTKRYTLARIRRLVLSAFLGITADYAENPVPYIKVLGFNDKGREILKIAKKTASKPIATLSSDFNGLDGFSRKLYEKECQCTDIFSLCTPNKNICGREQTENAVIIK